jgi:hypothetical protein
LKSFEQQTAELEKNLTSSTLHKDAKNHLNFLANNLKVARPELRMLNALIFLFSSANVLDQSIPDQIPSSVIRKLEEFGVDLEDKTLLFLKIGMFKCTSDSILVIT